MGRMCADVPLALIVAFDARQTLFGALTMERRGLIVRVLDDAKLRKEGRVFVEVRGGTVDLHKVIGAKISITVGPGASEPDGWRGWMRFNEPAKLHEIPIMRAIRHVRATSSRALVQYQGGGATMRLDLESRPVDLLGFVADLRADLVENHITATLNLDEQPGPLEAWNPPALILP